MRGSTGRIPSGPAPPSTQDKKARQERSCRAFLCVSLLHESDNVRLGPYKRLYARGAPRRGINLRSKTLDIWAGELARVRAAHWHNVYQWELSHADESDLTGNETEAPLELLRRAHAAGENDDRASAFPLYLEAAEAGSVRAMQTVAWHYWSGTGTAPDLEQAENFFQRAADAGSRLARVRWAQLLGRQQRFENAENILLHPDMANFAPAEFWLAWLRYERCKSRRVAREIRPLLESAASAGHPGAKNLLKRLMATGKLGVLAIPCGLRMSVNTANASSKRKI